MFSERGKRRTREAEDRPLVHRQRADLLVKTNSLFVPVQDRPFHPAVPARHGDAREMGQERPADSLSTPFRKHEQILEVETPAAEKRRVGGEPDSETDRL